MKRRIKLLQTWLEPINTAMSLILWILRDAAKPANWKILAFGLGIVFSLYGQSAIVFLLAFLFLTPGSIPGMKFIEIVIPREVLMDYRLFAPLLLALLFAAQAGLAYYCRRGMANLSIAYYRANAKRALNYYRAGLIDALPKNLPLLGSDMLISFCLRETRYLGGSFLSLTSTITSFMSLGLGLTVLFILDWWLTLVLLALILSAALFQATIIRKGMGFSRDILEGSGEMVKDIREHMTKFAAVPRLDPVKSKGLEDSLEVPGAERFLNGYQNRITLPYASALLAQMSFAIVLGLAVTLFLFRLDNSAMSSAEIFRYSVFLLPIFGALIGLLNAIIGITTSLPYFEAYIGLFDTARKQKKYHKWQPDLTSTAASDAITPVSPLGWNSILAPVTQAEWPEILRLRPALDASGVLPAHIKTNQILLMPSQWPAEIDDLQSFFGLNKPFDLDKLDANYPKLTLYTKEIRAVLERLEHNISELDTGVVKTEVISPREKTLLFIMAALQEQQVLIMTMRGFCSISERDRMYLVENHSQVSIICVVLQNNQINYRPAMHYGAAVFGDGSWEQIDPSNLVELDPALKKRINRESITLTVTTGDLELLT